MAPDLSEKLLGIDIDDADRTRDSDGGDDEQEELRQFVFVGVGESTDSRCRSTRSERSPNHRRS